MLSKQEIAGLRELHRLAHDCGDTRAKVDYMVAVDANLPALLDIAEAVQDKIAEWHAIADGDKRSEDYRLAVYRCAVQLDLLFEENGGRVLPLAGEVAR